MALTPISHDWRPGDRIASIAVSDPTSKMGLGTIQRIILDKAIVVWDDDMQSIERIKDLIYGGYDKSKIILKADSWWDESKVSTDIEFAHIQSRIKNELSAAKERVNVNRSLIAGFPLDIVGTGFNWGS